MNTQLFHDLAASEEASGYPANARALRAVPGMIDACNGLVSALDAIRAELGTQYPALSYHYVTARAALVKLEDET